MDIGNQQQVRYDRQIRLWGDEGQLSIQQARVCVFGSTALAAETMKSLVLAGIGSIHIIDKAIVEHADLGQNFFLEESALGKYRGECLVKLLTELNPSVHGQHHPISFTEFKRQDFQMLLQFTLVIGTNMNISEALQLDQFLFEHRIPFVYARVCGMLGYLRLSFREHQIWNSHSENDAYDLRLDCPFPELIKLANETDLNSMTHEQHSHTPYVLLYFKGIDEWRKCHPEQKGKVLFPDVTNYKTRKEFEQILMQLRQPDEKGSLDEQNFLEAKQNLIKGMSRSKVPVGVKTVLADPKAGVVPETPNGAKNSVNKEWLEQFWILASSLREFIERNGQLMPLSGQLPDMTSDSKRYAQLLNVYRKKAMDDAVQIHAIANEILAKRFSLFSSRTISSSSSCYVPSAAADSNNSADESMISSSDDETTTDESDDASRMSTSDPIENTKSNAMDYTTEGDSSNAGSLGSSMQIESGTTSGANGGSLKNQITLENCQSFLKNASKIFIQYGISLSSEFKVNLTSFIKHMEPTDADMTPMRINPINWCILLRALDRFRASNNRLPGAGTLLFFENDMKEMKKHVDDLFAETKDKDLIAHQDEFVPLEMIKEMCRFGGSEPHVVAAILGGCVAQEVIKLCTHQYVPIDNCLIFDGHTQQAASFRANCDQK